MTLGVGDGIYLMLHLALVPSTVLISEEAVEDAEHVLPKPLLTMCLVR